MKVASPVAVSLEARFLDMPDRWWSTKCLTETDMRIYVCPCPHYTYISYTESGTRAQNITDGALIQAASARESVCSARSLLRNSFAV